MRGNVVGHARSFDMLPLDANWIIAHTLSDTMHPPFAQTTYVSQVVAWTLQRRDRNSGMAAQAVTSGHEHDFVTPLHSMRVLDDQIRGCARIHRPRPANPTRARRRSRGCSVIPRRS